MKSRGRSTCKPCSVTQHRIICQTLVVSDPPSRTLQSQFAFGHSLLCSSLSDSQLAGVQTPTLHLPGKHPPGSGPHRHSPSAPGSQLQQEGREGSRTSSPIPSKPTQGQEPGDTRQRKDLPFLRHFWCPGRFKEDSVHQCSVTWTWRPAEGSPLQEQLQTLREGKPGEGNSFSGVSSCFPP